MNERQRMLLDRRVYGDSDEGTYRGIGWSMRRPNDMRHWCGYVHYAASDSDNFNEDTWEELEQIAHGGLTAGMGFDCAHGNDWYVGVADNDERRTYKDHEYVLDCIKRMIDCIKRNE